MTEIRKILIANRGEIALRVLRACRDLEIASVVAYSEADRDSLPVRMADETVCIGPPAPNRSYTSIPSIISAALITGCDAIHPGYGFLSENAYLADICSQVGLTFIGPPADVIAKMGDKSEARRLMKEAGVPTVPGTEGVISDFADARVASNQIGYPVLVKAVAGGGGRGMRVIGNEAELARLLPLAQAEAESAFGNGDVYIEKYLERPRHIEIQVLADHYGHVYAIGDRECSLQRRHQKIIEEAPAPNLNNKTRENLLKAAVKGTKSVGYRNAGTLEFLVDRDGRFYFMEMNTRIQVEHPITEMTSRIDLVKWQILIAGGQQLQLNQKELAPVGHAIECRITAEDPAADFQPQAGRIKDYLPPGGPGVRVDSHLYPGYVVPPNYDSMLGKICTWGNDREEAVTRMSRALGETIITGVSTSTSFLRFVVNDEAFRRGELHTGFIPEFMTRNAAIIPILNETANR